jgi:arylamine N-acetyltransferase
MRADDLGEILASLEVSEERPSRRYLELLFSRFIAKVPFESASKMAAGRPRSPEEFFNEFVELGAGGTCFDRALAFGWLLGELGFVRSVLLGHVEKDGDHGALRVDFDTEAVLADVGFPLPALLPLAGGQASSPLGQISLRPEDDHYAVVCFDEGPWASRQIRIDLAPVPGEAIDAARGAAFSPGAPFLDHLALLRIEPRGAVVYHKGRVRIDDAFSRTTVPLLEDRAAALSDLFGIDRGRLALALGRIGDPDPEGARASIEGYLDVGGEPEAIFARIAEPEGYRRLLQGLGRASVLGAGDASFRVRLETPGAPSIEEDVTVDPSTRTLSILRSREGEVLEGGFRVEAHRGGARLTRSVLLSGARPDLLRNDPARARIAAVLLADLLAWKRLAD